MVEKQKTETQTSAGGDIQTGTTVSTSLIPASKPELVSNDEKPNPKRKAHYGEYVIWFLILLAFVVLPTWTVTRWFLDQHAGAVSAIGTIAIMLLTVAYVRYSRHQWRVMEGQLEQMSNSSTQTERLIAATQKSAEAAERTAKALINSEAASVMVSFEWEGNRAHVTQTHGSGGDRTGIYIDYICTNQGRTAAWITEKRFGFAIVDVIPPEPDLDSIGCIQPDPDSVDAHQVSHHPYNWDAAGHITLGKMPLIWGIVRYEDVFGGKRETRFGYTFNPSRQLERIALPAYNKRT